MHAEFPQNQPTHTIGQFSLRTTPTKRVNPAASTRESRQTGLDESAETLRRYLALLEKSQHSSLLLILQGMDASGKDSAIRTLLKSVQGVKFRIEAFREPTHDELQHDFLWRVHQKTPAKGEIVIFNRSQYEDVLAARVRNGIDKRLLENRFRHIVNFESLLTDHQVIILKCFLHISKDEQRIRLQARLDDPSKHGKLNPSDFQDRERWDEYMHAYEEVLGKTSTDQAPWHVIAADSKYERDLSLQQILLGRLIKHQASLDPFNAV